MTHQTLPRRLGALSRSHVWNFLHCNVGPSDAARAKAILKRQRKAGKVLSGRAAKLKRRADLVSRGIDDDEGTRPAKRQQTLVISASGVDPAGRTALRAAAAAVERAGGGKAQGGGKPGCHLYRLCEENPPPGDKPGGGKQSGLVLELTPPLEPEAIAGLTHTPRAQTSCTATGTAPPHRRCAARRSGPAQPQRRSREAERHRHAEPSSNQVAST